jgi:hypothetical protein
MPIPAMILGLAFDLIVAIYYPSSTAFDKR